MDNDKIAAVLTEMHGILEEIEACPDLPDWQDREADMSHEEWMTLSERLRALHDKAQSAALSTVPNEVYIMLFKVRGAWMAKHDWGKKGQDDAN